MHTTIADFRTEDPPVLIKELMTRRVERVFRKENSVFDPWKEDDDLTLQMACENDLGSSKLSKIVKDPFETTKAFDYVFEKFAELKQLFLELSCNSHFPTVTQQTMDSFADDFKLVDKQFKQSALHICFAASYTKPKPGQTKMGLNRPEFIEILFRIAIEKYVASGAIKSP